MRLLKNSNFDFMNKKMLALSLSAILLLAGIVSLAINKGPKLSIDFKGGTLIELRSDNVNVNISEIN